MIFYYKFLLGMQRIIFQRKCYFVLFVLFDLKLYNCVDLSQD